MVVDLVLGGHSPMLLDSGKSQKSSKKVEIPIKNLRKNIEKKVPNSTAKVHQKAVKVKIFCEKVYFCGLWVLCGCNVDAMWMFRTLEKCQKSKFVGIRGGARAPRCPGTRDPWGLDPRASPKPHKLTFWHFSRLLNIHIASTLHPHSIHRPRKSTFSLNLDF